jgi:hypothetical protein
MDGSVSSNSDPTSNASTMIAASVAAGFFRPVTSTANVWVPGARPMTVKIGA